MTSPIISFLLLVLVLNVSAGAFALEWSSDSAKLAQYARESDRIITGMVIDREIYDDYEDVWIHVYEQLKDGGSNMSQAIVRVEVYPTGEKEMELDIGDEVLLMLEELDPNRGYFGLYHLASEEPPKYPVTLKNEIAVLLGPAEEEEVFEEENCTTMDLDGDEFSYCTYEDEDSRFYVPISVTVERVKQEMLKHVSKEYFDEHFDLRKAWDVAVVDGDSVPQGQEMEFEYLLDGYKFVYRASAIVKDEDLYLRYAPPREISILSIEESDLDGIVYACLDEGTYYVTSDRVVVNHVGLGFSPYIFGEGPPEVRNREGEIIREAAKRFVVWPETGKIDCFGMDEEYDAPIRSEEVLLIDASEYVLDTPPSKQDQGVWTTVIMIAGTVVAVSATVVWYLKKNAR